MAAEVLFTQNVYDRDGDVVEEGIYLHFGDTAVRVADSIEDFADFVKNIQRIEKELCGED